MFKIISYVLRPNCIISDLNDVVNNQGNYFIAITDSIELKKMHMNINFQYLEGAICIKYAGKIIMDVRYWDLVDQLWSYLLNLIETVLEKGEASSYFPDQPVHINFRILSEELLAFSIGDTPYILPKLDFLTALIEGAEQFFINMNHTFSSHCNYSYELSKVAGLKEKLR